eukprot:4536104-Pleurochrysis_carterae.AAC.1
MPREAACDATWHMLRVTLACCLLAAGRPDGIIQAICRWKSADAMRSYARLTAADYAAHVEAALACDGTAIADPDACP